MDYSPPKSSKMQDYQNAWTIALQNHQKWPIFDQNAWTIAHKNHQKCAGFDQNAWTIAHQNNQK